MEIGDLLVGLLRFSQILYSFTMICFYVWISIQRRGEWWYAFSMAWWIPLLICCVGAWDLFVWLKNRFCWSKRVDINIIWLWHVTMPWTLFESHYCSLKLCINSLALSLYISSYVSHIEHAHSYHSKVFIASRYRSRKRSKWSRVDHDKLFVLRSQERFYLKTMQKLPEYDVCRVTRGF